MAIHKEGYGLLKIVLILVLLILIIGFYFLKNKLFIILTIVLVILYVFLLWFFRNPNRIFIGKDYDVVAPVDGKVIAIKQTFEVEFFKKKCIQISIFMSPLNIHVTRYPVSGKVIYSKYYPGEHLLAYHPKASIKNEHTTVVVETKNNIKVMFRQIAGFLARRIVLYAKNGDKIKAGTEFGFIKFGSRLDLFLPLNSKIFIKIGQKTIGAKTIIASLN